MLDDGRASRRRRVPLVGTGRPVQKEAGTNEKRNESGVIVEVLPKNLYRVLLDGGRRVRASLSSTARHGIVRLVAGDKIEVKVSSHDPTRAMIIRKLS